MMRRLLTILFFCLVIAAVTGCARSTGSGHLLTDIRKVGQFSTIKASGIQRLIVEQGSDFAVKITADDNVIHSVLTSTRDGNLLIENRSGMSETDIEASVILPRLRLLEAHGRIKADCPGEILAHDFDLRLIGSGSANINSLQSDGKLQIYTQGSGNVRIAGKCDVLKILSGGSGSIFAEDIESQQITARLQGPGSVFVSASGVLKAIIESSGSLFYQGEPKLLEAQVAGSGDVMKR